MDSLRSTPEARNPRRHLRTLSVALVLLLAGAALLSWMTRPRPILAVTVREAPGSDRGTLFLLDPIRGTEVARTSLTGSPAGVAFAPAGDRIYVAGQASALVTVHDVPGLSVLGDFQVETRPVGLWFTETGNAFFVDYGPGGQKQYALPELSPTTASPTRARGGKDVPRGMLQLRNVQGARPANPNNTGPRPRQVFIDMELTEALIADSATGNVVGSVPVGPRAIAQGWDRADRKCYVVVNGEDAVKVVDPEAMVVTKTIPVGSSPNFFLPVYGTDLAAVLNQRSGTVSILDLDRDEVRHTVQLGGTPERVDGWPRVHTGPQGARPRKVAQAAQNR